MQTGFHPAPSARMLLLSNSRDTSGNYLVYARDPWADIARGRKNALFFPFAGTTVGWDAYLDLVRQALASLDLRIEGAHRCADLAGATAQADILRVVGGNTFRLLFELRQRGCLEPIRQAVRAGMPYVGWSDGSVLALQEGNWMDLCNGQAAGQGPHPSWWFRVGLGPVTLQVGACPA